MSLEQRRNLLIELLNDSEEEVRTAAAAALERLESFQDLAQIVEDLSSDKRGQRVKAIFAMEYVRGVPLTEYCDAQRLSTKERLDLFMLVCDGVQHAHQKGIIHRDIKPGNLLVTSEHHLKVADFGVSYMFDGDDDTVKSSAPSNM